MSFKDAFKDTAISLASGGMFTVPAAYLVYAPSTGIPFVDSMLHGASWAALTVLIGIVFIEIRHIPDR